MVESDKQLYVKQKTTLCEADYGCEKLVTNATVKKKQLQKYFMSIYNILWIYEQIVVLLPITLSIQ